MILLLALLAGAGAPPESAYDAAVALRRKAAFAEAAAAFERVAAEHPSSQWAPRALSAAGSLYQWQLADPARAAAAYDRVLRAPGEVPGVEAALFGRLAIERDRGGAGAELALVHALYEAHEKDALAPVLLMRASALLAEAGEATKALEALDRLIAAYPKSTWRDDALIRQAVLHRRIGDGEKALAAYRAIISSRRRSLIVGDYDSPFLDDAYFGVAETLEKVMSRPRDAEKAYVELADEVPVSRLVDDALHRASRLAVSRGDTSRASELMARLRRVRPGSRFAR